MAWVLKLLIICGRGLFGSHPIGQNNFYNQVHLSLPGLMAGRKGVLSNREEKLNWKQ